MSSSRTSSVSSIRSQPETLPSISLNGVSVLTPTSPTVSPSSPKRVRFATTTSFSSTSSSSSTSSYSSSSSTSASSSSSSRSPPALSKAAQAAAYRQRYAAYLSSYFGESMDAAMRDLDAQFTPTGRKSKAGSALSEAEAEEHRYRSN